VNSVQCKEIIDDRESYRAYSGGEKNDNDDDYNNKSSSSRRYTSRMNRKHQTTQKYFCESSSIHCNKICPGGHCCATMETLGSQCCYTLLHDNGDRKVIVGTRCCATMASGHINAKITKDATMIQDHISATITYVMWREENLRNVSVLQRVHLSNLVYIIIPTYFYFKTYFT
jgi:hypothetical protein